MKRQFISRLVILVAGLCVLMPVISQASPSFARQTGLECTACHTSFPQLTEFGRQFKINGYTLSNGQSTMVPLALTLQPSFTNTQKGQSGGASPGFSDNNNVALTQGSVLYAGRLFGPYAENLFGKDGAAIANKIGTFVQISYDGVDHQWLLDDFEFRYVDSARIGDKNLTYGIYTNNTPSLQDPWNSSPSWSFPFSSSSLAPTPAASPLISGNLDAQVIGLGGYISLPNGLYVDIASYSNLGAKTQNRFGIDPTGQSEIDGSAPYWRLAYENNWDRSSLEIGTFGLSADTFPGRDSSAGHDHTLDTGIDSQYQTIMGIDQLTARASWIHEKNNWNASQTLGNTTNAQDNLNTFNLSLSDWRDSTYGTTAQYFVTTGDKDALLYTDSVIGSPNSRGWIFEADWMPFNKQGGITALPTSRVKFALQYVMYDQFDGGNHNYDGAGSNAKDNNTLYLEFWFAI